MGTAEVGLSSFTSTSCCTNELQGQVTLSVDTVPSHELHIQRLRTVQDTIEEKVPIEESKAGCPVYKKHIPHTTHSTVQEINKHVFVPCPAPFLFYRGPYFYCIRSHHQRTVPAL